MRAWQEIDGEALVMQVPHHAYPTLRLSPLVLHFTLHFLTKIGLLNTIGLRGFLKKIMTFFPLNCGLLLNTNLVIQIYLLRIIAQKPLDSTPAP